MEKNQLNATEVFKNYVVGDTPENWINYIGIITDVKIYPSKKKKGDYSCKLTLAVKEKKELVKCSKIYKNILTESRCAFQELINEFEILEKDADGNPLLNFLELQERSCIVTVNALGNVKEVSCAYLGEDDEKEKQMIDFLESHVEITNKLDCSNIPSEVLHYCVIPMSFSNDEWNPNFVYHACIRSLTCHISDGGKDVDVKVSAYVFNGGNVRVMAKFFNRIRSGGKADFDDFCYAFDLVNEDGTVDPESASGQLCSVSLYQNSKGNFYIEALEPLEVMSDYDLPHYERLIQEAESRSYRR